MKHEILDCIKRRGVVTPAEVAEATGWTVDSARVYLYKLRREGLVDLLAPGRFELTARGIERVLYLDEKGCKASCDICGV